MNTITSSREANIAASGLLNGVYEIDRIKNDRTPVARFIDANDVPNPPAPAWYIPQTGDIYIHTTEAGIDIGKLRSLNDGFNGAKTYGLLAHEAAHAAISEDLTEAEKRAPQHQALLTMFEEVRVENHAIKRSPSVRRGLRASFTLILSSVRTLNTGRRPVVARAWALVHGRTLAGVATPAETKPLDDVARTLLGDDTIDTMSDLLQEVVTLRLPEDTARLLEICDEWVDLVGKDHSGDDDGCAAEEADGSGAKGSGSKGGKKISEKADGENPDEDDDGEGGDDGDEADEEDDSDADGDDEAEDPDDGDYDIGMRDSISEEEADALAEAFDAVAQSAKELTDAALKQLEEQFNDEWAAEPDRIKLTPSIVAAHIVFGKKRADSPRLTRHEPTKEQRQAVLEVSQVLSTLALPAVSKVTKASAVPPGRLRSREAVRASAERAQSRMVTAEPWKGTVRRHAVAKPLVVGIATDTSGSMKWAQRMVADFAYVYTNAGHRIGARTAAVTFGDYVYPIAKPGEVMSKVVGKQATDGTEMAEEALAALDGVLHLTTPSFAARILIVVSDGCLVRDNETEKVKRWLDLMTKAGTHVLWLGSSAAAFGSSWYAEMARRNPRMTHVQPTAGMTGFAALNHAVLEAIKNDIR